MEYKKNSDTAFDLLKSYLTNRKQYVVFDSCQSEHVEIYTGVPQGSILGPFFQYLHTRFNYGQLQA